MSVDITVTATIRRPCDEVSAFVTDPANDPRWIGGIQSARALGNSSIAVGTQVERVARFLGRRIEYVNEIIELRPDRLAMRSVRAPFPMRVTYDLRSSGTATDMTIRVNGDPGGFFRVASPLVTRAVRRNVTRDLANLKRLLEAT